MAFLQVGTENSAPVNIYYEDHGSGTPIVLIHGWPLSSRSWEKQVPALLAAGFRVISYDRRGFGHSSQPATGYDANTLAADLSVLLTRLDLKDAILVGFSMGGAEVARYIGQYGSERISKAIFISSVAPYLLKKEENQEGVDSSVFEGIRKSLTEDRPKFLTSFFRDFYNTRLLENISSEAAHTSWVTAVAASPIATLKCVDTWLEDFRQDLQSFDIPTLVLHGDEDKIVPMKASSQRMQKYISKCVFYPISGAPHGMIWTHAEELNPILLDFVGQSVQRPSLTTSNSDSVSKVH